MGDFYDEGQRLLTQTRDMDQMDVTMTRLYADSPRRPTQGIYEDTTISTRA